MTKSVLTNDWKEVSHDAAIEVLRSRLNSKVQTLNRDGEWYDVEVRNGIVVWAAHGKYCFAVLRKDRKWRVRKKTLAEAIRDISRAQ